MFSPNALRVLNVAYSLRELLERLETEGLADYGDWICDIETEWWVREGEEGDEPEDFYIHEWADVPLDILEEALRKAQALCREHGLSSQV